MREVRVDSKIGFIFSYPTPIFPHKSDVVDTKTAALLNDLLVRLNHKYPEHFPYCHCNNYKIVLAYDPAIINPTKIDFALIGKAENLLRIKEEVKDLDTIICFGEKGYFAIQKMLELYPRPLNIIKTTSIIYPVSRHIKVNSQEPPKRFRTNLNVLAQFNDIDRQLNDLAI